MAVQMCDVNLIYSVMETYVFSRVQPLCEFLCVSIFLFACSSIIVHLLFHCFHLFNSFSFIHHTTTSLRFYSFHSSTSLALLAFYLLVFTFLALLFYRWKKKLVLFLRIFLLLRGFPSYLSNLLVLPS